MTSNPWAHSVPEAQQPAQEERQARRGPGADNQQATSNAVVGRVLGGGVAGVAHSGLLGAAGNQAIARLAKDSEAGPPLELDSLGSGGAGHELPGELRAEAEDRFGADLGHVRVHTDAAAGQSAEAINARAFTVGDDIYFGQGEYQPGDRAGRRVIAHELAHVVQGSPQQTSGEWVSQPGDPAELAAEDAADRFVAGGPVAPATVSARPVARLVDDPDHPPAPAPAQGPDRDVALDWTPEVDQADPAILVTPAGTTRAQIAQKLYGDPNHFGGFDVVADKKARLRNLEGVVPEVATAVRTAFDARLPKDVEKVVAILKQRRINDKDEWALLDTTEWWGSRADLTNSTSKSYFDAYLDQLDTHKLEEWGLFSNTTKTASEWLIIEAEEKKSAILPLIARRSSRAGAGGLAKVTGPITDAPRPGNEIPKTVGTYTFFAGENRTGISEEQHGQGSIQVGELIVTEATAQQAEIALRNSPKRGGRVMIPGGDGKFYGYTIAFPRFWDEGYVQPKDPEKQRLERFWWHYPGTVFISGGEFQPEFAKGGEKEQAQRKEILTKALAGGLEAMRGLDFDVLSLLTLDQRVTLLGQAADNPTPADYSLITRVLYGTPTAEFPVLEHRISTNGTMDKLFNRAGTGGGLAMIGRIFTVKSMEAGQVPGEDLKAAPEVKAGFDEEGHYHYAVQTPGKADSKLVANPAGPVGIGQEKAGPGETPGALNRTVWNLQPYVFRLGGFIENLYRGATKTLMVPDGPVLGPYLPTQLVKVHLQGASKDTRVVSMLEAIGLLDLPDNEILARMLSTHIKGGMWVMAGMGLAKAFGPAIAEGLTSGAGVRGVAAGVGEAAATQAGRAAIVNTVVIGGMELVDKNREELLKTEAGRTFLQLYDTTMMIWVARDIARLITSGLLPKLASAADAIMAVPGTLRDALGPLRTDVEAVLRTVKKYASPAEAAVAATADTGLTMAVGAEARPSFSMLYKVSRGEVAAERLTTQLGKGSAAEAAAGKRVLDRLGGLTSRAEAEAAAAGASPEAKAAAERRAKSAADAQYAIANRATAFTRPEAREAFLVAVDAVVATRPNSLGSLTDLLIAAAEHRAPNTFIAEVQTLANRKGVSDEALLVLGRKAREGEKTLDLGWLNRTKIDDEALDFLGRDPRTQWDTFRRTAADPDGLMKQFRISARGIGAEMVAEDAAAELGTNVRRQVKMGSSEIDYEVTVAGRKHGFEIKGWTPDTWESALDAAIKRLNHKGLTDAEREAVKKIDSMLGQLENAQAATKNHPYLGITDALPEAQKDQLRRVLKANDLGGTQFVPLREAEIKDAAATLGQQLGIPRP